MSNEELQQRISYLVEHGGLYDDPLEDIRRTARVAVALSGITLVVLVIALMFHP